MSSKLQWTEEEDQLLRSLIDHSLPGGLNQEIPPLDFPGIVTAMNREAPARGISYRVYTKQCVYVRYYRHIRPAFETASEEATRELLNAHIASERAEKAALRSTRSNFLKADLAKQATLAAEVAQDGAGRAAEAAARATEIASLAAIQAAKEAKNAMLDAAERAEIAIDRAKKATDRALESRR